MEFLLLLLVPLVWLGGLVAVLAVYNSELRRLWREPVFKVPVLVLESDDWGAGPLAQTAALDAIAAVLRRHRDAAGRPPVLSLPLVLAVPDGPAMASDGGYRRLELDHAALTPVLRALKSGETDGVFALLLHGHEHYWPPSLVASRDAGVAAWLRRREPAVTEELPSALQSRWTDATSLPSRPLRRDAIWRAVGEEVQSYERIVGRTPEIVVPPTFVWTREVERAWAAHGIQCVMTPGRRYTARAADGSSVADHTRFANGDCRGGLIYLVRSDYFEPAKGRDAAYALGALRRAGDEGRACVLENHRVNFCGDAVTRMRSLDELESLIAGALRAVPELRFLSTTELLRVVRERDVRWIAVARSDRLAYWWRRVQGTGRLWKLLRMSGAAFIVGKLLRARRPTGVPSYG